MIKQATKSTPIAGTTTTSPKSATRPSAKGAAAICAPLMVHPIDLSFREAEALADFFEEIDQQNDANGISLAPLVVAPAHPGGGSGTSAATGMVKSSGAASKPSTAPSSASTVGKVSGDAGQDAQSSRALKISYNQLIKLEGFPLLLHKLQVPVAGLRWLDLSFNAMTGVDESLAHCPSLSHLYLHANRMESLTQVARALSKMPWAATLATLTLHDNPLSEHKDYKVHVLRACPRLRHLDHAGVTRGDRALVRHTHGVAPIGVKRS